MQRTSSIALPARSFHRGDRKRPASLRASALRNLMNTMAARPDGLRSRSVRLATGAAAVPEARGHVREAIRSWEVPVDPDVAILLTSELVTNAIMHGGDQAVTLVITCH